MANDASITDYGEEEAERLNEQEYQLWLYEQEEHTQYLEVLEKGEGYVRNIR